MFHISSPIESWDGPKPERHHDFIDVTDFLNCWRRKKITVEVEAKAKEVAVEKFGSPPLLWISCKPWDEVLRIPGVREYPHPWASTGLRESPFIEPVWLETRLRIGMLSLRKPTAESIRPFLAVQAKLPFTYSAVGATAGTPPTGYVVDHTRLMLGEGEQARRHGR